MHTVAVDVGAKEEAPKRRHSAHEATGAFQGLTTAEAVKLTEIYGANEIPEKIEPVE
jgi:hypothetical protein